MNNGDRSKFHILQTSFSMQLGNATAYSAANVYVKLHIGDSLGQMAQANPATETTRQICASLSVRLRLA
jgi:hypothetical protein